jgi:hypothetical protein
MGHPGVYVLDDATGKSVVVLKQLDDIEGFNPRSIL